MSSLLHAPSGPVDLLLIAGEHSGDEQGARLVRRLRAIRPELKLAALGGECLREAGAELLYPLVDHSVVGFVEVLRHYRFFKTLFTSLLTWVREHRPRYICLIDYPGFNLRFAARLKAKGLSRKGGGNIGVFYYIAPQVWAWKARRRFAMAGMLDALGVIFPFEVDCFSDTSLPIRFVGHPFLADDYQPPVAYDSEGPLLLLPGSRAKAVTRIFPIMAEVFAQLVQQRPDLRATVVYPSKVIHELLAKQAARFPQLQDKWRLMPRGKAMPGRAVLTSSGTLSLSCALAGLPGAIVYRSHALTYWLARWLINVRYLGIANLLLERPLYPEYIQRSANIQALLPELKALLDDPNRLAQAQTKAIELEALLSSHQSTYSAGDWLAEQM